jgi:hypothetical protein
VEVVRIAARLFLDCLTRNVAKIAPSARSLNKMESDTTWSKQIGKRIFIFMISRRSGGGFLYSCECKHGEGTRRPPNVVRSGGGELNRDLVENLFENFVSQMNGLGG